MRATTPAGFEQKQKRLELEGKQEAARQTTLAANLEWVPRAARPPGQVQGARHRYRGAGRPEQGEGRPTRRKSCCRRGRRLGDLVIEAEGVAKG